MSWDELDAITPDIRPAEQQREDLARLCLRVFATEDGEKLLAWLKQMYVDVLVAAPGVDASHAYFAEGQRTVVRDLIARVNQARNL